jgi:hypothetical protein
MSVLPQLGPLRDDGIDPGRRRGQPLVGHVHHQGVVVKKIGP